MKKRFATCHSLCVKASRPVGRHRSVWAKTVHSRYHRRISPVCYRKKAA